MYNLPNLLTISRIVVIPVIFLTIYIHSAWWYLIGGSLFIIAAITDYLDGYLAVRAMSFPLLGACWIRLPTSFWSFRR